MCLEFYFELSVKIIMMTGSTERVGFLAHSLFVNLLAGMWSRSRDGLETHQRLVSVSSRSQLFASRAQDVIDKNAFLSQVVSCDKELRMAPLK